MIPEDSLLRLWLESRSVVETPWAFDLACAMSAIGASLKRSVWIDQVKFRVYPNLSCLLVAGSGRGKDTAIDGGELILQAIDYVPVIGGRTSEALLEHLYKVGDPACAAILAGEFSEFFGPKDYQSGLIETITELMSNKPYKDISLKSDKVQKRIMQPTLTMMGGSTRDWLHTSMPESAMNGGFYPRFLIVCDDNIKRSIPLIKYSLTEKEISDAKASHDAFIIGIKEAVRDIFGSGEMILTANAVSRYDEFYDRRESYFSPACFSYATRTRDTALRIAMISAVSRHRRDIDEIDIGFADELLKYIGSRLDEALAPTTINNRVEKDLFKLLPCSESRAFDVLSRKYEPLAIKNTLMHLTNNSRKIKYKEGMIYNASTSS